jgi:hypothetical protein
MNEWNIQSRAHVCRICESAFEDKQPYHTLLFEEDRDLKRLDVCPACWTAEPRDERLPRDGFISYWQGVYEPPPAAPPEPIQRENAEGLLRKLIELNDPQYRAACYILAVMLERKRLLKVKEQIRRDGERIFIYEQPKTGDVFAVADPELQMSQLEEVQRQVAQLMEHGANPPPPQDPVPDEAADIPAQEASVERE